VQEQHINEAEAVQIHLDVISKLSLGVHWGHLPPLRRRHGRVDRQIGQGTAEAWRCRQRFRALCLGETRVPKASRITRLAEGAVNERLSALSSRRICSRRMNRSVSEWESWERRALQS
jgi:hypothetical protein